MRGRTLTAHQTICGKILYTSKKPERLDTERGREFFTLTKQSDGLSVLHAHCEIDDAPDVIRDVTASFETSTMTPIDGFVRISVGSKFEGCGWFQFDENHARCNVFNAKTGPKSVELPTQTRTTWFGHHAIINDGFLSRFFPLSASHGKRRMEHVMMSSPDHRGATGPMLFPLDFGVIFLGDETVTVGEVHLKLANLKSLIRLKVCLKNIRPTKCGAQKTKMDFFLKAGFKAICKLIMNLWS